MLNGDPWVEYRTRVDLLSEQEDSSNVISARDKMIAHPQISSLIEDLLEWPGCVLNNHKKADLLIHKLSFIADIGVNINDSGINQIIENIFKNTSKEGVFQVLTNIPVHFGGSGKDQFAWSLCDAPTIVYSLAKLGLTQDENVIKAKNFLIGLFGGNGYQCKVSEELGRFRGPGKKGDPCPYSTLLMLKLMSLFKDDRESENAIESINVLLDLWERSKEVHPYLFYMGNDFRKLKAPMIWYDIIHFADTLSNFNYAVSDERFLGLVELIRNKADSSGLYTPESEWKAWKGWEFGQKKEPSLWLTFIVCRILKRIEENKK